MKKRGRLTAVLLSGAMLCGIGTGCTSGSAQTYTWSNVAIGGGGYVTGMEYNPKEEGLVYARTDIGGLYRRKKDTDWVPRSDFLGADEWGYIGIESMATDPVEPNRVYFAGGTYMSDDAALFASDDYGETWTAAAATSPDVAAASGCASIPTTTRRSGSAAVTVVCGKPLTTARTGKRSLRSR